MSSERTFSQVFLIFCSIYCCFYLGSVNSEDLFVEEAGETDFIPIESEPEIRTKRESQVDYNYSYTNDYDENTQGKIITSFSCEYLNLRILDFENSGMIIHLSYLVMILSKVK